MKLDLRTTAGGVLLTVMVGFGPLATDMYLPSLPAMARSFDTTTGQVQLTLSGFLVGFAFAQLLMGPLADRFGRRPVLIGATALFFLTSVACVVAPSIDALIGIRIIQGVGACAGGVIGRAIVRDVYPAEDAGRVLAYMAAAMAAAPLIAPFIGGQLTIMFDWRANFVALTLFSLTFLVIVAALMPETNRHMNPEATRPDKLIGNYIALLKSKEYMGYLMTNGCVFAGLFAYISGSPFVFIDVLGVDPEYFGFYFGFGVVAFSAGSTMTGRLSRRFEGHQLLGAGALLAAASGLIMAGLALTTPANVWTVLIPMAAFGIAIGLVMPMGMAGAIGPFPQMAGTAAALVGFAQMLFGAVAGYLVGQLHNDTIIPMVLIIAASGVATLVSYVTMVHRRKPT